MTNYMKENRNPQALKRGKFLEREGKINVQDHLLFLKFVLEFRVLPMSLKKWSLSLGRAEGLKRELSISSYPFL